MELRAWIFEQGPKHLEKKFKVDRSTIYRWGLGNSMPTAKQLVKINELSDGKVTIESMVRYIARNQK